MLLCIFSGAVLLATSGITKTVNPATVTLTLYETDLFADQNATAATIFTSSTGAQVDIVNNPNAAFGQGSVPTGVYKRIKFMVQNAVTFSGPDPCDASGTPPTITKTFLIDPGQANTAQVELYFATSNDGGSGSAFRANGTSGYPFLLQNPIEVKSGVTNVVKLIFDTANTLACDNSSAVLLRPDMNVVTSIPEPPLACTANFPQQYWVSSFEINNSLFDQQGGSSAPTMTTILQQTGVASRWGTVTFNKPDANGNGTAVMTMNTTYDDAATPGIAENRHMLGDGSGRYSNPVNALATNTTMTVNYTMTGGGNLIIYTPDGTQQQGYFSDDCSAYVGVDISSNKVNSLNFGLKKPSGMASAFPTDAKFVMIGPAFSIEQDPSTHIWDFGFGPANTIISTSTGANLRDISFSWRTAIGSKPDYTTGTWSSSPAEEASADTGTVFRSLSVRPDGLVPEIASTNSMFWAFGSNGSLITAASTTSTVNRSTPLFAGMWINVDPSPSFSDLSGNWIVGSLHAHADPGDDGIWNNGNEIPQFGMVYGRLAIDGSARTFSGVFTFRDAFSGGITQVSWTGTVELHTDCYAYDPAASAGLPVNTPAASCTINGIQGITLPVFYLNGKDQNGVTQPTSKLVLDVSKKLIGAWDAPDSNGIPCGLTNGTCDPASSTGTGIGIKAP